MQFLTSLQEHKRHGIRERTHRSLFRRHLWHCRNAFVFQIKIPPAGQNLAANLLKQWPSYFAFVLSFIFIGIMWVNHHRLFTLIRKADDGLLVINLLLLLA